MIALLCSCLEPGKDGVGDYCVRLARALEECGQPTLLIALNDAFVAGSKGNIDRSGGLSYPALRLSHETGWDARIAESKALLEQYKPEWLSLQFVPWGYQAKGLPWRLGRRLQMIAGGRRWHLMLHELWLGLSATHSVKMRLLGYAQRRIILSMIRTLQPDVIHTSNVLFYNTLNKFGVRSGILPIFSNISRASPTGWALRELSRVLNIASNRSEWLILVVFGSMHESWLSEAGPWFRLAAERARGKGKSLLVVGVGKIGPADKVRFGRLVAELAGQAECIHLGAQSAKNISDLLQIADAGVATVERSIVGKSGSVAAYREHGLPVLVARTDDQIDRQRARAESLVAVDLLLDGQMQPEPAGLGAQPKDIARELIASLAAMT